MSTPTYVLPSMVQIPFTEAVPNESFYRHESWPEAEFRRFRRKHTMSQNLDGFTFWVRLKVHTGKSLFENTRRSL